MCNQRNCYPAAALFSQLCLLRDLSITVVLPHHILICDFAVQEGGVQRRMSRTTLCRTAISPHTLGGPHDSQFHSWINKYSPQTQIRSHHRRRDPRGSCPSSS